jgi:hypothetical protein
MQICSFYASKGWCFGSSPCGSNGNQAQREFTVYDRYSGTTNYGQMKNNQLDKLA